MISVNNFIFTENGIMSIASLYEDYIGKVNDTKNTTNLIKVATLNTDTLTYEYTNNYKMTKKPEESEDELIDLSIQDFEQIYGCKFKDIFSDKYVTINVTAETYILQYNIITPSDDSDDIRNNKYGVLRYLQNNKTNSKIDIGWRQLKSLINYSTHMPNITLGDTLLTFASKEVSNREVSYEIIQLDDSGSQVTTLPVFICQDATNNYNFVLVKGNPTLLES